MHTHLTEMNFSIHLLTNSKCFRITWFFFSLCFVLFCLSSCILRERIKFCGREQKKRTAYFAHKEIVWRKAYIWIDMLIIGRDGDGVCVSSRKDETLVGRSALQLFVASSFELQWAGTHIRPHFSYRNDLKFLQIQIYKMKSRSNIIIWARKKATASVRAFVGGKKRKEQFLNALLIKKINDLIRYLFSCNNPKWKKKPSNANRFVVTITNIMHFIRRIDENIAACASFLNWVIVLESNFSGLWFCVVYFFFFISSNECINE